MIDAVKNSADLLAVPNQPPVAIPVLREGQWVVRYVADGAALAQVQSEQTAAAARSLAGAWSDLDAEHVLEELDRLRHASQPTPPIGGEHRRQTSQLVAVTTPR